MGNIVYNIARQQLATGQLDLSIANLWIFLVDGYTPEIEAHKYVGDISNFETVGEGYYRQKLENVTLTKDTVNNRMVLRADSLLWTLANFSANGAVLYFDTGNDSTSYLITFIDFLEIKTSHNTQFKIEWNAAEGIINLQ